ncbi:MAG: AgmX/PglI C-terminal domain-containing protein [Myxococcota bacterium]
MAAQNRQRKLLRMAIFQDGDQIQQRVMKAGEPVTIGDSPKSTFVMRIDGLPSNEFLLFKPTPAGYALQVAEPMVGKLQEHSGSDAKAPAVSLKAMQTDPHVERSNGVVSIPLQEHHRGKIEIGRVMILFQFVSPPPVRAAVPIQQMNFRPRLIEEDDPVFLGFLGIWSALGIVLAIWVWRTEPRPFTLDDVPDRYVQLIPQPTEPEPELVVEDIGAAQERKAEQTDGQEAMEQASNDHERAKAERQRKDELIAGSPLLQGFVGTQGESSNGVVENLWSGAQQGLGDVDKMLSQAGSVTGDTVANASTRLGSAGGTEAASGGTIDKLGGGKAQGVAGPKVVVKPKVSAGSGTVDAVSGSEGEFRGTIKQYAGQLRYCYESILKTDPTLEGRVEVRWTVQGGKVVGVPYVVANTTGSGELGECVVRKIRRWEFPPDAEGDMSFPFLFQQK